MLGPVNRRPDLGSRDKKFARVIQERTKAPAGVEGHDVQAEGVDEKHLKGSSLHDFECQAHCPGEQVRAQASPLIAQVHGQPSQAHCSDGIALTESGDRKTLGFDLGDAKRQESREFAVGSGGQERPGRVATFRLAGLLAEPLIEGLLSAIESRSVHSAIPRSEQPRVRVTCADLHMHHVTIVGTPPGERNRDVPASGQTFGMWTTSFVVCCRHLASSHLRVKHLLCGPRSIAPRWWMTISSH